MMCMVFQISALQIVKNNVKIEEIIIGKHKIRKPTSNSYISVLVYLSVYYSKRVGVGLVVGFIK